MRRLPVRASRRRRALAPLALLVVGLLALAGCATVPSHSAPRVVKAPAATTSNSQRSGPEEDASPLQLVRSFVSAGADPSDDHAAARAYLTTRAAQGWNANKRITVISNHFDTVPAKDQDRDPNTKTIVVRGKDIGRLDADGGFRPDAGDFKQKLTLHKGSDGQWRIADPHPGVFVTLSDFTRYYRRVRVYFFDNRLGVPVPDLRYTKNGPADQVAGEIIDLLLSGPSESMQAAVHSAIPKAAVNKGSVGAASDGAFLVNLGHLGEQPIAKKKQIAEQIVRSLQPVTVGAIRLQADGEPMFPDHPDWRASDLPSAYQSTIHPDPNIPGLVVADQRLYTLAGKPVPGPAGNGSVPVLSAARAIDGTRLAVVAKTDTGMSLRVGKYGQYLQPVNVDAGMLTRPTWAPGNASAGYRVWTVADGHTVIRVAGNGNGSWSASKVDATSLTQKGPITALRLSRDGSRVAAVVGGKLVVASVLHDHGKVSVAGAYVLQGGSLTSVVDVAWQDQTTLVAATKSGSHPVVRIPVDGLQDDHFATANLSPPVIDVAAAPNRPVVVSDHDGLWTSTDANAVWTPNTYNFGPTAVPFYPG